MPENLTPSKRKYSDDTAEQAFATYVERRTVRLGAALIGHLSAQRIIDVDALQDFVWEQALDFVAPMEPDIRDDLQRAGADLPWTHRHDPALYWRLMYAAQGEKFHDTEVVVFDAPATTRPLKQVVCAAAILIGQLVKPEGGSDPGFLAALRRPGSTTVGRTLYQGIIDRAGRELRLRAGLQRAPKPLELASRARMSGVLATIENYGFDGSVTVSRETEPSERGDRDWSLDVRSGRWTAVAWPWQLESVF